MKLYIPENVWDKVLHWAKRTTLECSGMGIVEVRKGDVHVVDAFMCKQKNSGGETNLDEESTADLIARVAPMAQWGWWWHSHNTMGAKYSNTDDKTINEFARHGWMTGTVLNHKAESQSYFCMYDPVHLYLLMDTEISKPARDETVLTAWNKEFDDNHELLHSTVSHTGYHGMGFRQDSSFWKWIKLTKAEAERYGLVTGIDTEYSFREGKVIARNSVTGSMFWESAYQSDDFKVMIAARCSGENTKLTRAEKRALNKSKRAENYMDWVSQQCAQGKVARYEDWRKERNGDAGVVGEMEDMAWRTY